MVHSGAEALQANGTSGPRARQYTSGITYTLVFLVCASALLASADSWHAISRDSCVQVIQLIHVPA